MVLDIGYHNRADKDEETGIDMGAMMKLMFDRINAEPLLGSRKGTLAFLYR